MAGQHDYDDKRERRIERFGKRAAAKRTEGHERLAGARRIADMIPLGQPILVGHHSEKRHRRDIDRIDSGHRKGFEALNEAEQLERRAASAAANETISSDDPKALDRLREKLAGAEAEHARWKLIIATHRHLLAARESLKTVRIERAEQAVEALTLTETERRTIELSRGMGGGRPHLGYKLTNGNKEIKRIKDRIKVLELAEARGPKADETIGECTLTEADNRVRILFPGKPSAEIIAALKGAGFRWSGRERAWQRMASDIAWRRARELARLAYPEAP